MAELLVEIFSEEIPARMQKKASEDFAGLIESGLKEAGLAFSSIVPHVTPRRLVCVVDGMDTVRPDVKEERRGPKVGAPEKALEGFLRGAGLDSLEQCEKRETPKGDFWFAIMETKGGPTIDVLPTIIDKAISSLVWPKSMRWGQSTVRWVRPMHRIVALFDGAVVDGSYDTGDRQIAFSNETEGHRFLNRGPFTVSDFADYQQKLLAHNVVLDREERKAKILEEAEKIAHTYNCNLLDDRGLLEEVAGLVEWPIVLCGEFDKAFLEVPKEVLIASMKEHQKYFSMLDQDGALANRFVVVANKPDNAGVIVAGNEKVLHARLSDAKFFWDQDLKVTLESRLPKLEAITFHEKLGTVAQKAERMKSLAALFAPQVGAEVADAERAAVLCKADLVSEMVFEFPEVQGLMGYEYALKQGEKEAVAQAIADHYSPAGPSDACPSSPVSVVLALGDRIDTISGFFAIDLKPTGSKDPFALRRAALGIIRLISENNLDVNLWTPFEDALTSYSRQKLIAFEGDLDAGYTMKKKVVREIFKFMDDRLKVMLRDQGYRYDMVEAVLASEDPKELNYNILQKINKVKAICSFLDTQDGEQLMAAYRRAVNIVRAEEKKEGQPFEGHLNEGLFSEYEEGALFEVLEKVRLDIDPSLKAQDYEKAMSVMITLRSPLDAFFEKVIVNDNNPDVRVNRLRLLANIRSTMDQVADFSKIEG